MHRSYHYLLLTLYIFNGEYMLKRRTMEVKLRICEDARMLTKWAWHHDRDDPVVQTCSSCGFKTLRQTSSQSQRRFGGREGEGRERVGSNSCPGEDEAP